MIGRGNKMNKKLWVVTIIYEVFVAIPYSVVIGTLVGAPAGFGAFVGFSGLYVTALLLVMGLVDYARC